TTSDTREKAPREITRRDDQRTEQGDERPQERVLGETGRGCGPCRSFERRGAVCGRVRRPGRLVGGKPGGAPKLGGHGIRAQGNRRWGPAASRAGGPRAGRGASDRLR